MPKIIVLNNRGGLEQVQLQPVGKDLSGRPMVGKVVTLIPGVNMVDVKDYEAMRKNPVFDVKFKTALPTSNAPEHSFERAGRPILELMKGVGKEGLLEDEAPLSKLPDDQCERVISETLVVSMLKQWLSETAKPSVRHLLDKRIEFLSGNPANAATAGQ